MGADESGLNYSIIQHLGGGVKQGKAARRVRVAPDSRRGAESGPLVAQARQFDAFHGILYIRRSAFNRGVSSYALIYACLVWSRVYLYNSCTEHIVVRDIVFLFP